LFPTRAPCFIQGEGELCWAFGLDYDTGQVVSERHQPQRQSDGSHTLRIDADVRQPGLAAVVEAMTLGKKAQDSRVRCYTSRRGAYFDCITEDPMSRDEIKQLLKAIPASQAALTDALVLSIAGDVPRERVQEERANSALDRLTWKPGADREADWRTIVGQSRRRRTWERATVGAAVALASFAVVSIGYSHLS